MYEVAKILIGYGENSRQSAVSGMQSAVKRSILF